MIKIAIIEDEQAHTELLSSYLRTWGTAQGQAVLIQTFLSAESFLFVWEETNDFDILFVDIQMGKMNGVEMAEKVRERDGEIAESISEMERQLGSHGFIRCHRSYLCRIESICRIGKTEITLDSGSVIPVSRRMYAEVNRAFIAHFRQD